MDDVEVVAGNWPSPQPTASPVPTSSPNPSLVPTSSPTRSPTPLVHVANFADLSSAIVSNTEILVTSDITLTSSITISGKTNVKIYSSTNAVLSASNEHQHFYIESGSDVTFTGLGFASGSAERGGCMRVMSGSTVDVDAVNFTSCTASSDSSYALGGAMYLYESTATISGTTFSSTTVSSTGGVSDGVVHRAHVKAGNASAVLGERRITLPRMKRSNHAPTPTPNTHRLTPTHTHHPHTHSQSRVRGHLAGR